MRKENVDRLLERSKVCAFSRAALHSMAMTSPDHHADFLIMALIAISEALENSSRALAAGIGSYMPPMIVDAEKFGAIPRWRPIASAPDGDEIFFAGTDDGRVMIVRGDFLASMMNPRTPDHLSFPAVKWMPYSVLRDAPMALPE